MTATSSEETRAGAQHCAVVVLVGPGLQNSWRAVELIRSLLSCEPALGWCVLMDDAPSSRGLSELPFIPPTCKAVTILNSMRGLADVRGGQTAGVLKGLSWIWANTTADYVLKVDLDALAVAPFDGPIRACLNRAPNAGVHGVFWSCNPDERAAIDFTREARLRRAYRSLYRPTHTWEDHGPNQLDATLKDRTSPEQLRAFDRIKTHVEAAMRQGFETCEDCQGGACVVSRRMIDGMGAAGFLDDPDVWRPLPFGDDQVLAMYARAVGLQLQECSQQGDPFGVQTKGLPYALEELAARGYSFVHSIKNDRRYDEATIRAFFQRHVEATL